MKITSIKATNLRNDEHYAFFAEVRDIILKHNPQELRIGPLFQKFTEAFDTLDVGFKRMRVSTITQDMMQADRERDQIFSGMVKTNKGALNHFDENTKQAARRIDALLRTYGNLAQKNLNAESAGIVNLVQDLEQAKYSADAEITGLTPWISELKARNNAFMALVQNRLDESAERSYVVLKQARAEVEAVYKTIAGAIETFVALEGLADYEKLIRQLNLTVDKYNAILARRGKGD
jgi:hypothetical protein